MDIARDNGHMDVVKLLSCYKELPDSPKQSIFPLPTLQTSLSNRSVTEVDAERDTGKVK